MPCAPVYRIDEVVDDPQVRHLANVGVMHHEAHGEVWAVASPFRFEGSRPAMPSAPPALGEDSDAILAAVGYGPDDIARLRTKGIV